MWTSLIIFEEMLSSWAFNDNGIMADISSELAKKDFEG